MKKFLMITTAIAGAALMSSPASAAIDLNVGGFFRGYVVNTNSDTANVYNNEFRRDAEVHVKGETVLDNGLTVGAAGEFKVENGTATVAGDEFYAYASNAYGRVNLGDEDGAAYLLQVGAPSADSNIDGWTAPVNSISAAANQAPTTAFTGTTSMIGDDIWSRSFVNYAHRDSNVTDRATYLTPQVAGFQAGVSYAPNFSLAANSGAMGVDNDVGGFATYTWSRTALNATTYTTAAAAGAVATTVAQYQNPYELALRYDGKFQDIGVQLGAGWSAEQLEAKHAVIGFDSTAITQVAGMTGGTTYTATDGFSLNKGLETYNVGANLSWNGISFGGSYLVSSTEILADRDATATTTGATADLDRTIYAVGAGYDFGNYHAGVSYYDNQVKQDAIGTAVAGYRYDINRYTVGGTYKFGPGMTVRAALAWGEIDSDVIGAGRNISGITDTTDNDYRQITVGTDIQF